MSSTAVFVIQTTLSLLYVRKDLKNILSNANLPVVLLIFLSTKAKKITPKKKKNAFFGFYLRSPNH